MSDTMLPAAAQGRRIPATLILGDGIGPEVVRSTRRLIDATGAPIDWEEAVAGASAFRAGVASGVPAETIASLKRTRLALKGPLETPVGFGEKSANVTLRKLFETYGNLRPVREFPGVPTPYEGRGVDLIVVRENVEDLYAGIEHAQTPGVAQCLKLISRKGCERIARLAFEVARAEGRKSVHCATKANIMKLTEGLLKRVFESVAGDYPEIAAHHVVVDNCAHQLVKKPEQFEVIVTTNMNGDILSDLASGLIGGLGFAPSANLGDGVAIFEAVHGSAPKYAGKDVANPTALILSGVMLLRHAGLMAEADLLENAVLATLEDGRFATRDINPGAGACGTAAFTDAVLDRFGCRPKQRPVRPRKAIRMPAPVSGPAAGSPAPAIRSVAGIDVFVESTLSTQEIGQRLEKAAASVGGWRLKMVSNRGTLVYPETGGSTDTVDHWRCRFMATVAENDASLGAVYGLLAAIESHGLRWMHLEKLSIFDGVPGFTKAQGED